MSFECDPIAVAEMLVHECAHHYFHLSSRLEPVDDGTDHSLYFSPVKNTGRPIDKILLAYHAFANVLIFYRTCLASDIQDHGYCRRNATELVPQLKQLESALRETTALTETGNSLWLPLAERTG